MTPVLIAVIALAAVAITVSSTRRARAERDAVERHHRTLSLIGSLTDQAHPAPPPAAYHPRHRKAAPLPRRRSRAWAAGGAGAAVAAMAIGWLVVGRPGLPSPRSAVGVPATPAPATAGPPKNGPATTAPPEPTTAAAAVVLVSSTSHQAHYRLLRPSADVEVVAGGSCWVEIRSALGQGPVQFAGALSAGGHRLVPTAATGGVSILLGKPGAVSVSVDGTALALPRNPSALPFTVLLEAATS